MPTIDMTERDLRNAMQDPRYWQAGHPEREDYARWVGNGWRQAAGSDGSTAMVQVRAYTRTRNGRTEQVDSYTQTRQEGSRRAIRSAHKLRRPRERLKIYRRLPHHRIVWLSSSSAALRT